MLLMLILCVVVFALLLLVAALIPPRSPMSRFELERRAAKKDQAAIKALERSDVLVDVVSLQRVILAVLLVLFVPLCFGAFEWFWGMTIAVLVALEYGSIARLPFIKKQSLALYERYERYVLTGVKKFGGIFRLLRSVMPNEPKAVHVDSREELLYLIDQAGTLLSGDEKKLMTHGLTFEERLVNEVMTPRGVIDSISKKELLGPLVLDDLHKTGHSRFPVIDSDVDHIVGVLHVQNLLSLDNKRSITAEKAMEPRVFYIHENQSLSYALAAFLRTHHHLFIVVNEFRETVGLITLEDVIEALLGRKIIDEFDTHEDLRAVALRNPRGNNSPAQRKDV